MLPLNSTPCPQSLMDSKIDPHRIGDNPVHCVDCLKYVNVCITLLRANTSLSMAENQQVVFQNSDYLVKDLSLEEHYLWMRRAEALAASVGLLYQQRIVKEKISNPKGAEASREFTKAIREQKDAARPKKERRLLSDREKAIDSFVKLGITIEKATKMVDDQMSKEGRNPGGTN